MSITDPKNLSDIAGGIGNQLGKGFNQFKSGVEDVVPGLKNFDKKVGDVVNVVADKAPEVANKTKDVVEKAAGTLDPNKALKNFDPSQGTASIGENLKGGAGLKAPAANPDEATVNKVLRPK